MICLLVFVIIYVDITPQINLHYFKGCAKMISTSQTKELPIWQYALGSQASVIHERESGYMKHDQLFKELIHQFFGEFLEAFFPEVHEQIDFQSFKPLSEEMFTDLLDGESRRADMIIETRLKGEDTLIIIHVEPQSTYQSHFHKRMYLYFSLLYNKYRKPILPIAVFSYDEERTTNSQFVIEFPFHRVLEFNFLKLELRQMDWRKYLKSNNPIAAALLSKMGYNEREKVQVKREFLRMITTMELTPAKMRLVMGFFERYLTLNEREEEMLMEEIEKMDEAREILHLPISWEEKGIKKGREEGKIDVVIEMLKEDFPMDIIVKVTGLDQEKVESLKKDL